MKLFEFKDVNSQSPADYMAEQIGDAAVLGVRRAQEMTGTSDPNIDTKLGASHSVALGLGVQPEPRIYANTPGLEPVYKRIP